MNAQKYDLTTPLEIGDWCYVVTDPYKGAIVQIWRMPDGNNLRYGVKRDGFTGLQLNRRDMHLLSRDKKPELASE
jgi:hypothetical protein